MKKGISEIMSAVLLLVLVVSISLIVSAWLSSTSREESENIRDTATEQLSCQFADLYIKEASYNCSASCSSPAARNLTVRLYNSGKKTLQVDKVFIRNATGGVFSFGLGGTKTAQIGEDLLVANISVSNCTGINNSVEAVVVSSVNCPANARDELLAGSGYFHYYGC